MSSTDDVVNQEFFKVNQNIVWRRQHGLKAWEVFGFGPFKVVSVEEVPNNCTCGAPMLEGDGKAHVCPHKMGSVLLSVGHSQFLRIADQEGNPIGKKWSGAWFKHL